MIDPKQPREFSDMSDYPQDGYGNLDADRPDRIPADDEQIEDEEDLDYSPNEDF